ncbi:hypothetical protein PI126_g4482 [Phytophthora idaei]|nr:hypothetical protein PI126_g4482 [Phytophthora idaei]
MLQKKYAKAIDSYLAERQNVRVGDIAHTHWAISQARQPDDAGITLPESATLRQMQHLDAMSASRHEDDREEGVISVDPRLSNMEGVAEDVEGGISEEM